jgi:hypothetical protein
MMRWYGHALIVAAGLAGGAPVANAKAYSASDYAMPVDRSIRVALLQFDVQTSTMQLGSLSQPDADGTLESHRNLTIALRDELSSRNYSFNVFTPQTDPELRLVQDYVALHRTVAFSILESMWGHKLPTKKRVGKGYVSDWTMGSQIRQLGELAGATHGLFLYSRDDFANDGRKALQVAGLLGCVVGACTLIGGGSHVAYLSLVDLETGQIVWFNVDRRAGGDPRDIQGAAKRIGQLMATLPGRADDLAPIVNK